MKRFGIILGAVALLPSLTSCAWRTSVADHVFGPTFYRFNGTSALSTTAVQTVHVPFLFEGGRQWSLGVGGVQRLALVPGKSQRVGETSALDEQPRALLFHPQPDHWQFSLLYLRTPLRQPPVFIHRSVAGATGGVGSEERTFSLGYSSITATLPREEAIYRIEFDSRRPLDATLVMNPAADNGQPQHNPPPKKGKP